jgi:hypothetical protein
MVSLKWPIMLQVWKASEALQMLSDGLWWASARITIHMYMLRNLVQLTASLLVWVGCGPDRQPPWWGWLRSLFSRMMVHALEG